MLFCKQKGLICSLVCITHLRSLSWDFNPGVFLIPTIYFFEWKYQHKLPALGKCWTSVISCLPWVCLNNLLLVIGVPAKKVLEQRDLIKVTETIQNSRREMTSYSRGSLVHGSPAETGFSGQTAKSAFCNLQQYFLQIKLQEINATGKIWGQDFSLYSKHYI